MISFQRLQIALALWTHAILVVFEKNYSCLFIPNCTLNHVITYTRQTPNAVVRKSHTPCNNNDNNNCYYYHRITVEHGVCCVFTLYL